jgi:hypothetical protein
MGSARFTTRHWFACAATWVAACAWGQVPEVLTVCLPDYAVPPYLTKSGEPEGTVHRLILDSARHAGLKARVIRLPPARCMAMLERSEIQATIAGASPHNFEAWGFPLLGNNVDPEKRLARLRLIWIKSRKSQWDWTGSNVVNTHSKPLLMGTLSRNQVARDGLERLGVKVDAAAYSTIQLMAKVVAGRIDGAVMMQEEFDVLRSSPEAAAVDVLPRPFLVADYYLVVRPNAMPAVAVKQEAWWSAIAKLRPLSAYQAP